MTKKFQVIRHTDPLPPVLSLPPSMPLSFLKHFYESPFFSKACSFLSKIPSFPSFKKKVARSIYENVRFHFNLLGSSLDLMQRVGEEQREAIFLPTITRIMVRSLSVICEQQMSAGLMILQDPFALAEHSHVELAKSLQQNYGLSFSEKDFDDLGKINYGVVTHRYPYSSSFYFKRKNLPLTLQWLLGNQSIDREEIKKLFQSTLSFLSRHHTVSSSTILNLESALATAFDPTTLRQHKPLHFSVMNPIHRIFRDLNPLLKKIKNACNSQEVEKKAS